MTDEGRGRKEVRPGDIGSGSAKGSSSEGQVDERGGGRQLAGNS